MSRTLVLALRQTWVDWRAGELRLALVAMVLAVAAVCAVGWFVDRLHGGLARDAAQLLGGDVVVQSDQPAPPEWAASARAAGLQVATQAAFPSMARAPEADGGAVRLAAVKAVSAEYPLRGRLRLRDGAGAVRSEAGAPAPGTVWIDPALADALGLQVGGQLLLGDATLHVAALIELEPDRGAGFLNFAPRVLLRDVDLPATGLVQPASRVTYRLALAAPPGREAALRAERGRIEAAVKAGGLRGIRVESLAAGRPETGQALTRAQTFLNLVALLAVVLAAVAVAIAVWDFAQRHLGDAALLRVLGVQRRALAAVFALELLLLALVAALLGAALGWGLHMALLVLLAQLAPVTPGAASVQPLLIGVGVALALALGFGLASLLQLARVPPLRVLRREVGRVSLASGSLALLGAAALAALLWLVADDPKLGALTVGGLVAACVAFVATAWGVLRLVRARAGRWHGAWAMAARQWTAKPLLTAAQVAALAVGLTALALLVLLRTDLIASWQRATPADAPNRFAINIQPDQAADVRAVLADGGVPAGYDWYPMVRARLVAVNGQPVTLRYPSGTPARRMIERELNVSFVAQAPAHNRVTAGRWQPQEAGALSLELDMAQTLGARLGDVFTFDVAGQISELRITSLRAVNWGSMRANFYVLLPRSEVPEWPATYLAAYRAPPGDARAVAAFDKRFSQRFANVTVVDVAASVAQLQAVLAQVIRAVEVLFAFALAVGLTVLAASLAASREGRLREAAVLRALGAPRALLARVQRTELLATGALAGLLAGAAALIGEGVLARQVFDLPWQPPWAALPLVALAGALLAWAAGWWSLRGVLTRPVVQTLRRAAE